MDEFVKELNLYNGKKPIFASVYAFSKIEDYRPIYDSAIIDRIFFDFDGENSYHDACILHDHLSKEGLKHLFVFSGRGYHIYLRVKNAEELKNKKVALLNAHNYFEKLLAIKIDEKIKGDIARVSRVLNTWNAKGKLYCIPITDEDLHLGEAHIKEKAKSQTVLPNLPWFGNLLYDLSQHDNGNKPEGVELLHIDAETERVIKEDELLKSLPKCVSSILASDHFGWRNRYLVIVYLKELGHTRKEVVEILKNYMKPKEFEHCMNSERQVDYLYRQLNSGRLKYPSCHTLRGQGACPFKYDCSKARMLYK